MPDGAPKQSQYSNAKDVTEALTPVDELLINELTLITVRNNREVQRKHTIILMTATFVLRY